MTSVVAAFAVAGERVGLAARSDRAPSSAAPEPLAERMLDDEPLEIGDELDVPAEPQPGVEATLEALRRSSFSLAASSRAKRSPSRSARASPRHRARARWRGRDSARRSFPPASARRPSASEPLEPLGVDLRRSDDEPVAGPLGDEPSGRQRPPKLRDVQPQHARRRRRRRRRPRPTRSATPPRGASPRRRARPARTAPWTTPDLDPRAVDDDLERAEQLDVEPTFASPLIGRVPVLAHDDPIRVAARS